MHLNNYTYNHSCFTTRYFSTGELARSLNCDMLTSASMIKCLRDLPYKTIMEEAEKSFPVSVIEDGHFITASPRDLWQKGHFHKVCVFSLSGNANNNTCWAN